MEATCHDCGVKEGQVHGYGCDMEQCPFCGTQLISCDCCYFLLGLYDKSRYGSDTNHLPPTIYEGGLPGELEDRWFGILGARGRVPYIRYPNICARCGCLWPELFMVPDEEWTRYVQMSERGKVLCRGCYDHIKAIIDGAVEGRH
jgi:hypothetical protein